MYLKKFFIAFHNGSNYDYHFNIKELAEESKRPFTCLGESAESKNCCGCNRKRSYKN